MLAMLTNGFSDHSRTSFPIKRFHKLLKADISKFLSMFDTFTSRQSIILRSSLSRLTSVLLESCPLKLLDEVCVISWPESIRQISVNYFFSRKYSVWANLAQIDCYQVSSSQHWWLQIFKSAVADNMGVLKLTDFGFAKETHTRDTLQTPCYTPYYVGKSKSYIHGVHFY